MSTATMRKKVEKLLRLAESSNPHEAELATKKAEELMVQWGIEAAELDAHADAKEAIVEVHRHYSANSRAWVPFAHRIVLGLGGLQMLRMSLGGPKVRVYLIGHKSDVERAEMLLDSLQIQAERALAVWWSTYPEKRMIPQSQWYKAKHQFIWSFGTEVGERLRARRTEQVAERGTGTELMLVDREKQVVNWMYQNHSVRKSSGRYQGSAHGSAAGRAAGAKTSLGDRELR